VTGITVTVHLIVRNPSHIAASVGFASLNTAHIFTPRPRLHAAGNLDAVLPFDHGNVVLALQIEPELRAVAEVAARRTAVSAVIERRPFKMS